jgi:hypothetical protein
VNTIRGFFCGCGHADEDDEDDDDDECSPTAGSVAPLEEHSDDASRPRLHPASLRRTTVIQGDLDQCHLSSPINSQRFEGVQEERLIETFIVEKR